MSNRSMFAKIAAGVTLVATVLAAVVAIAEYLNPQQSHSTLGPSMENVQTGNGAFQIQNNGSMRIEAHAPPSGPPLECRQGNRYTIKSGRYGAVNKERHDDLRSALDNNNKMLLEALLTEKLVVELPAGSPACKVNGDFYKYLAQIEVPGDAVPYWVREEDIEKLD